jgi:site-specific recombinase XerD
MQVSVHQPGGGRRLRTFKNADLAKGFYLAVQDEVSRLALYSLITQVAQAAGLEALSVHPHSLRHSCGYSLVNKGTDIWFDRKLAGTSAPVRSVLP